MSTLAPDLFQRRFQDLMEIGRARLPSLAPDWTDHNAHDPGITLMELLAWVAEAQLYSLSRVRRDERMAFAALLGIAPRGTRGAQGLIWPDRRDPGSPATNSVTSVVIPEDTVISVRDAPNPTFRPASRLLWAPGRIARLETRDGQGRRADHTTANQTGSSPFLPFGERAGGRDVLLMRFECRDSAGLFGANRKKAMGALWPIGVSVAPPPVGAEPPPTSCQADRSPLSAAILIDDERIGVRIASDSTCGLLSTGALMLDLDSLDDSPRAFTLELRLPGGSPRPPRVLRIEPNVLPILQGRTISSEVYHATGEPDWSFSLSARGLRFAAGEEPVTVQVSEPAGLTTWTRRDRLSDHGPDEPVYECDFRSGEVTFGNGVNGRIPPAGAQVLVSYSVSDGDDGFVARNRSWAVSGFEGTFGVNPDPITGGAPSSGWAEDRREARRRSKEDHPLVSADDIAAAARALPLLEVARSWVVDPGGKAPRTGAVTLVAVRRRTAAGEPAQPPESARWLESIRRRLAPRMLLGSRLVVVGPRYVDFSIQAVAEADPLVDPAAVEGQIRKALENRLALVDAGRGSAPRRPGVPVTRGDVAAWIRATPGVKRVVGVQLLLADGRMTDKIAVPRGGLPRWIPDRSTIEVRRPETARSR